MKLIILLICLALQVLFKIQIKKQPYFLLDRYAQGMKPLLTKLNLDRGYLALVALIIPVLIVILLLNLVFGHGILYLIYGVIVLMVCLDYQDMKVALSAYFDTFASENLTKAQSEAEKFIGHSVHQDQNEMSRAVTETIFTRSLSHVFAVIFWFMLLGPFGALLYYLTRGLTELSQKPEFVYSDVYGSAELLKDILDWLPVRVLTLTFALVGQFGSVFSLWVDRIAGGLLENRQFLVDAGVLALNDSGDVSLTPLVENQKALTLISRAFTTWIVVISVVTVISWI